MQKKREDKARTWMGNVVTGMLRVQDYACGVTSSLLRTYPILSQGITFGLARARAALRMNHAATARRMTPTMTPMAIPAFAPPERPELLEAAWPNVGFAGLPPNGQKSPPSGGRMHVIPSPSAIGVKFVWVVDARVLFCWNTNGAGVGVVVVELQFGPLEPMKDVLPTRMLFNTVKLVAEVIAIP